jgi:zinc protease
MTLGLPCLVTAGRAQHIRRVALAILLAGTALPLCAQQPGEKSVPVSKAVRLNRAPVSKEVLHVKLPKPYETTLPNGLRVLILEDHRFPLVDVSLLILGAGTTSEPAAIPGLASTTAAMLKEGTRHRSSREIAEETEKLGAAISFFAPFGGTAASMSASGLSDNFNAWFALALDQLLDPKFPVEELAKMKQRMAVRLKQQRSSPQFLARERTALALYCGNPDDRETCLPESRVSETEGSLESLTPGRLAEWHHQRYVPQNALLAISGDVDTKALVAKLAVDLGGWKRTEQDDQPPPPTRAATSRRVFLVDRPNSVQTTLWLGNVAIDRRGLHPRSGSQPRARRRPGRAALPEPARRKGLHLRRVQQFHRGALCRGVGRGRRRSPGRDRGRVARIRL